MISDIASDIAALKDDILELVENEEKSLQSNIPQMISYIDHLESKARIESKLSELGLLFNKLPELKKAYEMIRQYYIDRYMENENGNQNRSN